MIDLKMKLIGCNQSKNELDHFRHIFILSVIFLFHGDHFLCEKFPDGPMWEFCKGLWISNKFVFMLIKAFFINDSITKVQKNNFCKMLIHHFENQKFCLLCHP